MFSDSTKYFVCNPMHARIPNGLVKRNTWLNLCYDVASFATECL